MKHVSSLSGIFLIVVLLNLGLGCSNEVDFNGHGEPIPIVYCLLNPIEQVQYVRVGKSFIRSMDQIDSGIASDSLSWTSEALVYIERWENDNPVETTVFAQSNFTVRDSGLFPVNGLMVYEAELQPEPGGEYHLFVYLPELDKIVSGICKVMSVPEVIDPEIVPGRTVSFDTISTYNIRWRGGTYTGIYQGVFKMNYSESYNDNFEHHFCYFTTPIYIKQLVGDVYEEEINGLNFLKSVAQQIDPVPGIQRELINFEFIFYAGGSDLAVLVDSELGVASPFTLIRNTSNISGGTGVFSCLCYQRFPNLEPSVITKYFLATSLYTKDLGFKSD